MSTNTSIARCRSVLDSWLMPAHDPEFGRNFMKRGTPEHPKVTHLMKELSIHRYAAAGLLECLWHFTSRIVRRGDVGRYPDEEIARQIYWEGDAKALIKALVKCGWLERHKTFRLVVHDWHDHADDSVRKTLKKYDETFWNGLPPRPFREGNDSRIVRESFANRSDSGAGTVPALLAKPSLAKPSLAKPSLAKPSLAKPSLASAGPAAAGTGGGGGVGFSELGGGGGEGAGGGSEFGSEVDKIEVQGLLARAKVNPETQRKLLQRKDVTASRLRGLLKEIASDPSVSDIPAVLVHRLNQRVERIGAR